MGRMRGYAQILSKRSLRILSGFSQRSPSIFSIFFQDFPRILVKTFHLFPRFSLLGSLESLSILGVFSLLF